MARLSRSELATFRSGVHVMFNAPSDGEMRKVVATFERIHGRRASTSVQNYLIRLYRVHGPATAGLMEQIYRERGTTENLLLLVEIYPRTLVDEPSRPDNGGMDSFTIV